MGRPLKRPEEKSKKTLPPRKSYRKNLSDAYKNYLENRKDIGYSSHPTMTQYRDFIRYFFHEMYLAILWEDYTWFTPIGTFTIKARKRKKMRFAWKRVYDTERGMWIYKRKIPSYVGKHTYRFKLIKDENFPNNMKFYSFKLIGGYVKEEDKYLGESGLIKRIVQATKDWKLNLPVVK